MSQPPAKQRPGPSGTGASLNDYFCPCPRGLEQALGLLRRQELHAPALGLAELDLVGGKRLHVPLGEVLEQRPDEVQAREDVDAERGGVALNFDQLAHAKVRHVCDRNNGRDPSPSTTPMMAPLRNVFSRPVSSR